jgi:CRISPR-associated protein Csb1
MEMNNELTLDGLIAQNGPTCLVIKARLEPLGAQDRFQPAGFPEVGHVIYDAPRGNGRKEKVCIIDSAASMANHLESVCMAGPNDTELHPDLSGLPYVVCATDRNYGVVGESIKLDRDGPRDKAVVTSLTEGHRVASDYFLDALLDPKWVEEKRELKHKKGSKQEEKTIPAHWEGRVFRDQLRREFGITEIKKGDRYFIHPEDWWTIYQTVFKYDPNSLIHGILLAKEQIKISRLLTASLEAFGAARVGRSGVKFDRLGKTLSGQPIFAVDEETANEIRATFILDLALLRSYGRDADGLSVTQKRLLLGLALWKVRRLLAQPFRFRSQCYLKCTSVEISAEGASAQAALTEQGGANETPSGQETNEHKLFPPPLADVKIEGLIKDCKFGSKPVTRVYYPASDLFKIGKEEEMPKETLDLTDESSSDEVENGPGD